MQGAVLLGGQGHEWMWHREADGSERPIRAFMVHKSRFLFDRLGNMALKTRQTPVWGSYIGENTANPDLAVKFPRGKFTYHVYRRDTATWDHPENEGYAFYGRGEDTNLYYPVTFDNFVLRFRMKYIEKFGIPPTIVYHPDNEVLTGQALRVAESVRGESVILIPRIVGQGNENSKYKIEQLNPPASSYDLFQSFTENWTRPAVNNIILGSADEMQQGENGGYSSNVSRHDTGPQVIFTWDAKNICSTFNYQMIPAMVTSKWPNLPATYWPRFSMESKEEKDQLQDMQVIEAASKLVPVCEDEVYEKAGLRKPKATDKTVGGQGEGQDPFAMLGGQPGKPAGQPGAQPGAPTPFGPRTPHPLGAKPTIPGLPRAMQGRQNAAIGQAGGAGAVANTGKPPGKPQGM